MVCDKVTARQRLDLNLERGYAKKKCAVCQRLHNLFELLFLLLRLMIYCICRRTREELSNQSAETNNLTDKLDRVSVFDFRVNLQSEN
jgi:hypothetical protein